MTLNTLTFPLLAAGERLALDGYLCAACSPWEERSTRIPVGAWPEILARAGVHKVANLVLERWARAVPELPADLRFARHAATARNLAFTGRLLELLTRLEGHGIEALPFKGPLLAEQVFGGVGNRSFGDLDILVPRDALPRACELLADAGYRTPSGVSLREYLRITLRGGHHIGMEHARHRTYVELHWEMAGRYLPVTLDFTRVRPFLERTTFSGREMWTLNPEIGLLYLCVHGAKEYWRILDHVVCVAWHLERRPPDWEALIELARQWGGLNILLTGLGLAAGLFELALPKPVAGLIEGSPAVRRLVERQSRRIFEGHRLMTLRLASLPEFLRMHWTQLGDPIHFARWTARHLTTPALEDLRPAGIPRGALASTRALAPVQAIRRLLGG